MWAMQTSLQDQGPHTQYHKTLQMDKKREALFPQLKGSMRSYTSTQMVSRSDEGTTMKASLSDAYAHTTRNIKYICSGTLMFLFVASKKKHEGGYPEQIL